MREKTLKGARKAAKGEQIASKLDGWTDAEMMIMPMNPK